MPRYVFLFYFRNYDQRYFRRRFNILETQSYDALEAYINDAVFGPLRNPPPPRPPPPPQAPPRSPQPHRGDSDDDDDDDDGEVDDEICDIPVVVNDGLQVPDGDDGGGAAAPPEPIVVTVGRRYPRISRSFYYNYHENFERLLRNEPNFVAFRHTVAAIYAVPVGYLDSL